MKHIINYVRCIIGKPQRANKRIVIGGDFNNQFRIGIRGLLMDQFVEEFCLRITNASVDWPFEVL